MKNLNTETGNIRLPNDGIMMLQNSTYSIYHLILQNYVNAAGMDPAEPGGAPTILTMYL